ncbi:transporter [Paenibacillus sp. PL91]|uniref:transporter n=1 Tax=Paenibacillus sp. PL91 TaxID=2729538 RepID=UPI002950026D|nr:transporter [Paenibacillus sp. PL91]
MMGPTAPPPQFTPQQPSASLFAVDPGAISGCLFRNTYVWLNNGQNFWFFPIFVGRRSVAGFRWFGRSWGYTGIDLRQISTFTCF